MTIKTPTTGDLVEAGTELGLRLTDTDAQEYLESMAELVSAYRTIDGMIDHLPAVKYPRTPGYRPDGEENTYNAWAVKASIRGAPRGKLSGKKIVIKDNVCVAGVPMMNGASILEGYVPEVDATIVTRILDAGGEIVGKAHCEYYSYSGGSHTNATGRPVQNPWKPGFTSGGSSSGSAALVAGKQVDMAIGCDQAGSIRVPSSFCGIYGMKPSFGLVPYTGIMAMDMTIDHAGPMTSTVADNALLLEVIAGPDGLDPRQSGPKTEAYRKALDRSASGMRIALVTEGFGHPNSESDVDQKVRSAAKVFSDLGVTVDEVSIPMHRLGVAIWIPIGVEGTVQLMMHGNGFGTNWKGLYLTSLLDANSSWKTRAAELSESLKYVILLGQHMLRYHRGRYYAKAQNLARRLSDAYGVVLAQYDLLMMPTLPIKATPIPPADAPRSLIIRRAHEMIANTCPFDVTPYPAMTIPCGLSDELPIGLMLVAKQYEEATIYRAAHAFEQARDWKKL